MEVDEAPALELDHLDVGEAGRPSAARRSLSPPAMATRRVEAVAGALPQARHVRVPQHRPPVVEALGAQRVAEERGRRPRGGRGTTSGSPVGTASASRAGAGTARGTTRRGRPAVHGTERRGGQGDEELGVLDHRGVDALAAPDAGGHQLPGVGLVEAGARRADGGPAVLARDEERALGQLAGRAVQGRCRAGGPGASTEPAWSTSASTERQWAALLTTGPSGTAPGRPAGRWRRRRGSGCGS